MSDTVITSQAPGPLHIRYRLSSGVAALQSLAVASRTRLVRIEARELDITV